MMNLIDEIIEIDRNAKKQVEVARIAAEETVREAEEKSASMKAENNKKISERLEKVRDVFGGFADEEIAESAARRDAAIKRLDESMKMNGDAWKKEIISGILA